MHKVASVEFKGTLNVLFNFLTLRVTFHKHVPTVCIFKLQEMKQLQHEETIGPEEVFKAEYGISYTRFSNWLCAYPIFH